MTNQISDRLKYIRKKRGLTQTQLATICNTSRSNIACWENGSRFPKYDNLIILSIQLNIDLNYLCGLDNTLKYDVSSLKPSTLFKIDELIKNDILDKITNK